MAFYEDWFEDLDIDVTAAVFAVIFDVFLAAYLFGALTVLDTGLRVLGVIIGLPVFYFVAKWRLSK